MNPFTGLFKNRAKSKIRQNLVLSVDDRVSGDHEVLSIKTTSANQTILEINGQTNKIAIDPNDLQEALSQAKDFIEARGKQPGITRPLGTAQVDGLQQVEEKVKQQEEAIKEKFDLKN